MNKYYIMMTYREWIDYKVNPNDIWAQAVDPTGYDRDNMLIPLGLANYPENYNLLSNHPEVNSKLLFYSFGLKSGIAVKKFNGNMIDNYENSINRVTIKEELDKRYTMTPLNSEDYYNELGKYKFNISPEGNGIDCYRHYETWISKGIPIIEYSKFIEKKYKNLPILWTKSYSEINDDYLNKIYGSFLDKKYDFRRLLLSCYEPSNRQKIINVSKSNIGCISYKPQRLRGYWNYEDYFN